MMKVSGFNKRNFEGGNFPLYKKPADTLKNKYGRKQITGFKVGTIVVGIILLSTLIYTQIIQGSKYQALADRNRARHKEIKPLRGLIYDKNETPLVENQPNFTLIATPFDIYQQNFPITTIIETLKNLYPDDIDDLNQVKKKLQTYSYLPVILKKNISYQDGIKLIPTIEKWPGVFLQEHFTRKYLFPKLTSHIIGYTGFVSKEDLHKDDFYSISDTKGKSGIEAEYEKQLRGTKGTKKIQINSFGKEGKTLNYTPSQKGANLHLTIDLKLQKKITEILQEKMKKFNVQCSAVIAMDPRNGTILALVSLPTFNNNLFTTKINLDEYNKLIQNPNKPLFNRAISGEYPPGSTFKLIVGYGALEDHIINQHSSVVSTGGIKIGQWFFPDWRTGGHGVTNIRQAIAWSVNTYFYTVGGGHGKIEGLGISGINKYAKIFNLGKTTGIDLPSEKTGFLPTPTWKQKYKKERWYLGDTYHVSIGQGDILVTPMQVALWTSFFANNGTLYRPTITKEKPTSIDKKLISSQNIKTIKSGLRDAVTYGSASSLNALNQNIAGKTGSAQFAKNKKPHGWFTGFAPFDEPEIVLVVLMEQGDGAKSALAVAYDFFNYFFNYF